MLLIGTSLLILPTPAVAVNECGAPPAGGGTVTCPTSGNPYADGIEYAPVEDLTIVLEEGVVVEEGITVQAGAAGVDVRIEGDTDTEISSTESGSPNDGVHVTASGTSYIAVDDVSTTGDSSRGIFGAGVEGSTVIADTVVTSGDNSGGVFAVSGGAKYAGGDVSVTVNSVVTSGDNAAGISAASVGGKYSNGGDVTVVSGTVSTSGDNSQGILASSVGGLKYGSGGTVTVTSESVTTAGDGSTGIDASSAGGNVVVTSGTVETSGDGATGIRATADLDKYAEGGTVTVVSGDISTAGIDSDGIYATAAGNVSVTSGTVATLGDDSRGIAVESSGGDVTIVSETVTTGGAGSTGISAVGSGVVEIESATVTTTGDNATGIYARQLTAVAPPPPPPPPPQTLSSELVEAAELGPDGGVSITSGDVTTSGDNSPGIDALAEEGDVEIVSSGAVRTSGEASAGIVAESANGFVAIDAGTVEATGIDSDAIVATSATTSTVTIRGLVRAVDGLAVQANGGAATVNLITGATLRGAVDLTDNDDIVNNAGTFDAIGDSQFGAGDDVFNNTGTTRVVNGAVTMVGLEQFNNLGTIDMRDGAANDSLTVDGYHAGSTLGIDVNFATGDADVLNTGLATGVTEIEVQPVGPVFFNEDGILVVDAGAGTVASAFTLAPFGGPYVRGVLEFDAAEQDFYLFARPDQPVFETSQIAGFTSNLWYESADAIAAQLDSSRDALGTAQQDGRRVAAWVQVWTDKTERDGTQSFTLSGTTDTFDVSYERDFQGVQGGVDMLSGPVMLGLTFGLGDADLDFDASGNPVDAEVKNLGAYAEYRGGGFFLNGLAKFDWVDFETQPGTGLGADFDANMSGVQVNGGYRFGGRGFYAEPSVGISWVGVDIDSYVSGPATIEFEDTTSVRARAGVRVGGTFDAGSGALVPFAALNVYDELNDGGETSFSIGNTIRLDNETANTNGELQGGLSFISGSFETFVRGEYGFGEDYDSQSVRGGIRFRF